MFLFDLLRWWPWCTVAWMLVRPSLARVAEAYPEGGQGHLSSISGRDCRMFEEGMFGILPTGIAVQVLQDGKTVVAAKFHHAVAFRISNIL